MHAVRSNLILESPSFLETLKVFLGSCSHALQKELGTTRAGSLVESPNVLDVLLSMGTNKALVVRDFNVQSVEVISEALAAESILQLVQTHARIGLDVLEHVDLEIIKLILIVGFLHISPGRLHVTVSNVTEIHLPWVGALGGNVSWI